MPKMEPLSGGGGASGRHLRVLLVRFGLSAPLSASLSPEKLVALDLVQPGDFKIPFLDVLALAAGCFLLQHLAAQL